LQQFLRERNYVHNVTVSTREWYESAWKAFTSAAITQADLQRFVVHVRERGVRPVSCNTRIRALNAFCRWLHEQGEAPTRVKLAPQRLEKRIIRMHDDAALRTVLSYHPKTFAHWRIHALIVTILDTGCRIDELLTARVRDFDFDNLLLTALGPVGGPPHIPDPDSGPKPTPNPITLINELNARCVRFSARLMRALSEAEGQDSSRSSKATRASKNGFRSLCASWQSSVLMQRPVPSMRMSASSGNHSHRQAGRVYFFAFFSASFASFAASLAAFSASFAASFSSLDQSEPVDANTGMASSDTMTGVTYTAFFTNARRDGSSLCSPMKISLSTTKCRSATVV
jgi:integrase